MSSGGASSRFEQMYRCCSMSYINKEELEKGDKIIMPPSALDRLAQFEIDYPMLFQLTNPSSGEVTHCGVLEFTAEEGMILLPSRMMKGMAVEHGDLVMVTNISLPKGTYVKLRPHTKDFLDVSNPRAILERTLRNYSCLTSGGSIVINYNNKKFVIDILETKPSDAVCIIETDCEADFAPPLDYVEPAKPTKQEVAKESEEKMMKHIPFTGSAKRLDGKPSTQHVEPVTSPDALEHRDRKSDGCKDSPTTSRKLVFGSDASNRKRKNPTSESTQDSTGNEEKKFKAFSGRKYLLSD